MMNEISYWLMEATLSSSLLIIFLLLIRKTVVRYLGARWSYALWSIPALRMAIPFFPQTSLSPIPAPASQIYFLEKLPEFLLGFRASQRTLSIEENAIAEVTKHWQELVEVPPQGILKEGDKLIAQTAQNTQESLFVPIFQEAGWPSLILFCWFLGVIMMGIFSLLKHRQFEKRVSLKADQVPERIENFIKKAAQKIGLKKRPKIIFTHEMTPPLVLGIFQPTLIFSSAFFENYTKKELNLILLHELIHIKRKDLLWTSLANALRCVYWFNPLVYIALQYFRLDQELSCDQYLLSAKKVQDRKQYGEAMIKTSSQFSLHNKSIPEVCKWLSFPQLEERIMMLKYHKNSRKQFALGMALMIFLGFTSLTYSKADGTLLLEYKILNKEQLLAEIPGNTFYLEGGGHLYFASGGESYFKYDLIFSNVGRWYISEKEQLCTTFEDLRRKQPHCYSLRQKGELFEAESPNRKLETIAPTLTVVWSRTKGNQENHGLHEFVQPAVFPNNKPQSIVPSPDDINYQIPQAGIPMPVSSFLGKWEGLWNAKLKSFLVIEEIDREKAKVVFGWEAYPPWNIHQSGYVRFDVPIKDPQGRPSFKFGGENKFFFQLSEDRKSLVGYYYGHYRGYSITLQKTASPNFRI